MCAALAEVQRDAFPMRSCYRSVSSIVTLIMVHPKREEDVYEALGDLESLKFCLQFQIAVKRLTSIWITFILVGTLNAVRFCCNCRVTELHRNPDKKRL